MKQEEKIEKMKKSMVKENKPMVNSCVTATVEVKVIQKVKRFFSMESDSKKLRSRRYPIFFVFPLSHLFHHLFLLFHSEEKIKFSYLYQQLEGFLNILLSYHTAAFVKTRVFEKSREWDWLDPQRTKGWVCDCLVEVAEN
jgi:hypothetical protein